MKKLDKFLSIPKTIFFNFYYFPIKKAIKLPIRVSRKVKIGSMGSRNSVRLMDIRGRISIGFGGSFALGERTMGYWYVGKNAVVIFKGSAFLGRGIQFICNGEMIIGSGFWCNADCILNASKYIEIGNDALWGWRCYVLDGDGHKILPKQKEDNGVSIGDHVWLASDTTILKGSRIGKNSVVGAKGCISKEFFEENLLLGGFNNILKKDISWEK